MESLRVDYTRHCSRRGSKVGVRIMNYEPQTPRRAAAGPDSPADHASNPGQSRGHFRPQTLRAKEE